jgi:hypothetical protein
MSDPNTTPTHPVSRQRQPLTPQLPTGDELERARRHATAAANRLASEEETAAFNEKRPKRETATAEQLLAEMYPKPEPAQPKEPQGVVKFGIYVPTIEEIMDGGARTKKAAQKILADIEAQAEAARIAQEGAGAGAGDTKTGDTKTGDDNAKGDDTIAGGNGTDGNGGDGNADPANG